MDAKLLMNPRDSRVFSHPPLPAMGTLWDVSRGKTNGKNLHEFSPSLGALHTNFLHMSR